jgi:hypothetical protein
VTDQKNKLKERLRQILEQEAEAPMCDDQEERPATQGGVVIGDIKGTNITVTINCVAAPKAAAGGGGGGLWRSVQSQIARRLGHARIRNDHFVSNRLPTPPSEPTARKSAEILEFRPPHGV